MPCIYICLYLVLYILLFQTGFRGQQRDAVQSEVPVPSPAVDDGDGGSPCPEDGEFFNARPDAAETEEAIGNLVSGLERLEQSGFNELHSLLSKLPVLEAKSGIKMSYAAAAAWIAPESY